MHLLVLFLMMNHQCMVMNHLKLTDWFCKCNIYKHWTMSIYGILTTKYIRYSLRLLCLLYSPVGVSLIRIQQMSYLASIFHCTPFQLRKCPDGAFRHLHWTWLPRFQGKNSKCECRKWSLNDIYTPQHWMMKLVPAQFHCNLSFSLPRKVSADVFNCLPGSSFCRI
jgi:hypothetical protein